MRKSQKPDAEPTDHPRWVQWLNNQPAPFYLLAAFLVAALLIAVVMWLDERTLALAACAASVGLFGWLALSTWRQWREAEMVERICLLAGCLLLLGASAANLVRFMLVR
jgi:hypothetical protein